MSLFNLHINNLFIHLIKHKFYLRSSASPQFDCTINTTRGSNLAFHIKWTNKMIMSIINLSIAPTHWQIPHSNRLIICTTNKILTAWMELQICDPIVMAYQGNNKSSRFGFKNSDFLISATSCDKALEIFCINFSTF